MQKATESRVLSAIDADAHVLEPGDLWTRYLEARFRDAGPRLFERDGKEMFQIEAGNVIEISKDESGAARPGGIGMREGKKPKGGSYYDGKPGGFDPHQRIPDMDAEGIDAAFLFPTLGLFIGAIQTPELAAAAYRAYNRWLADYCAAYPERLYGVAMLPMQSPEAAAAEIAFAARELGLRAGFIRPNPYLNRPLHHRDNDPVWRAAEEHDFAIAIHASAASVGMAVLGEERFSAGRAVRQCTWHALEMQAALVSFVMCGICDRFPGLRVGYMEAGGGWVAGWLDRMDRCYDDRGLNDTGLSMRPSDLFRRQCFISFEPIEGTLPLLADYIGRDNILWATDYPHSDGFTDAPGLLRKLAMPADMYRDIMQAGAKRFYHLN
jgi:predicted TIM-barrel fold metal-dependent hydrolase